MRYPFEYFCGANVVIYLGAMPLLETCGFSYSIRESKRPIYGYSSRHFDAVARGQVLVEGTLLINYVHQDYLFHAARLAASANPEMVKKDPGAEVVPLGPTGTRESMLSRSSSEIISTNGQDIEDLTNEIWKPAFTGEVFNGLAGTDNLHDGGGFEIRVAYGNTATDRPAGDTGLILSRVHFTGRAKTIQIDAETIVEAYSFFARDIRSTKNPRPIITTTNAAGERVTSL